MSASSRRSRLTSLALSSWSLFSACASALGLWYTFAFGLYFRCSVWSRAFVARFVTCLRCSVCRVPSFPLVECLCSRLRHSFLASAFVLGFGIRSRLLPSLPALAFVLGTVYGVWSSAGIATPRRLLHLGYHHPAFGALIVCSRVSCSLGLNAALFCDAGFHCCSFAMLGLAAALSQHSVSLLFFRNTRSRCCSFATFGLAAALSRRSVSLLPFRVARSRCPSSSASFQPLFETGRMCFETGRMCIEPSPTSKGHSLFRYLGCNFLILNCLAVTQNGLAVWGDNCFMKIFLADDSFFYFTYSSCNWCPRSVSFRIPGFSLNFLVFNTSVLESIGFRMVIAKWGERCT